MRSWNWNGKAQLKEEARGICRRKRTPKKIQLRVKQRVLQKSEKSWLGGWSPAGGSTGLYTKRLQV